MELARQSTLSTAQFAAGMEHSPIGTAVVGLEGQWLWTNIAIRRTLGYTKYELGSLSFQDITHPEDLELDLEHVRSLIAGSATSYEMEKRYLRKDGGFVWCLLSVSIVRDNDAIPQYFISQVQDISQRKADEIDRAKLTERLTLATRAGGMGVWEWDVVGGGMIWDGRMFELYGLDLAAATPDRGEFFEAIIPNDRDRVAQLLQTVIDGQDNECDTEFSIAKPCGEVRQLRAMSTIIRDNDGNPLRMIGTNLDVTEMRQLVTLAEQAAQSKAEFLATISHELRTPLNSIIGFSRLVLDSAPPPGESSLPPTAKRHIELVRDASATLLTIVDDVLDFSRIEAGGFELSPVPFDLREMVASAVAIMRSAAEEKGLSLSLSIAPHVPSAICGDQNRIRQILINLLGNAIKFTVTGLVAVNLSMKNGQVLWEVRDSGIGIAADKQHLLFKRFSQVDQSIARQFGGSGLGLAICERLVSAMGGAIGVDSKPGCGSTFWFSAPLPIAAELRPGQIVTLYRDSRSETVEQRRILLAEDVEMNQILAVALLERAGHHVTVVANGFEALERVQVEVFDLVLMDVQMPVMDGIEATRRIRALGGHFESLPIIAVTANVMPEDIARFRSSGMSDHVGKPIPIDAFAMILRQWCPSDRQEGAPRDKFAKARSSARSSAG